MDDDRQAKFVSTKRGIVRTLVQQEHKLLADRPALFPPTQIPPWVIMLGAGQGQPQIAHGLRAKPRFAIVLDVGTATGFSSPRSRSDRRCGY